MRIAEALQGVTRIFLDTAPIIYFVEGNPVYLDRVTALFDLIDTYALEAITSPITLAECLVHPCRQALVSLQQDFTDLITTGVNTRFVAIGADSARRAAELRARYNLSLTDSFQIAVALDTGCDAFLTNDLLLRRVTEIRVITLEELGL